MQYISACKGRPVEPIRKFSHVFSLLLAFSLFGSLFAACGGGSTASADKITLNVMVSAQPVGGENWWKTVVTHFEKANPNITVKLNYQPNLTTANQFAATAIQTGTPLDVAAVQESETTTLMAKNALAPLNSYIQADKNFDIKSLSDVMVAEATKDGQTYGIPFYAAPSGRIYNKNLFTKAGVQSPSSYKDLLPVCQALQKAGVAHPLYEDFGGYPGLGDWTSWDAFPLSPDGQKVTIYPHMMTWASFYHDLVWKYNCIDPAYSNTGTTGKLPAGGYSNDQLAWKDGSLSVIAQMFTQQDVLNKTVVTFPEAGPKGQAITIGGSHLVIPASSKYKDAAWKFISFEITSKVDQKNIALQLHDQPVMASLANDPDIKSQYPQVIPFIQMIGMHTVAAPNVPWYYQITYGPLHTQILNMMRDPNSAHIAGYLQQAQSQSEAIVAKDQQLS